MSLSRFVQQLWTPIANIESDLIVNGLLTQIVVLAATAIMFLPFFCIHLFWEQHPFFLQYKIHKNKPLTRSEFTRKVKIWVKESLLSLLVVPLMNYVALAKAQRSVDQLPNLFTMIWQIAFIILVEETMFYWIHRFMHHIPWLMQRFHRHHHTEQYTDVLSTRIFHSVDDLIGNWIPITTGAIILSHVTHFHLFTFWCWWCIMMFETTLAHSGYDFPWSIVDGKPHAYHHSHYCDNYGSFMLLWDRLLGTNSAYLNHLQKKEGRKAR